MRVFVSNAGNAGQGRKCRILAFLWDIGNSGKTDDLHKYCSTVLIIMLLLSLTSYLVFTTNKQWTHSFQIMSLCLSNPSLHFFLSDCSCFTPEQSLNTWRGKGRWPLGGGGGSQLTSGRRRNNLGRFARGRCASIKPWESLYFSKYEGKKRNISRLIW